MWSYSKRCCLFTKVLIIKLQNHEDEDFFKFSFLTSEVPFCHLTALDSKEDDSRSVLQQQQQHHTAQNVSFILSPFKPPHRSKNARFQYSHMEGSHLSAHGRSIQISKHVWGKKTCWNLEAFKTEDNLGCFGVKRSLKTAECKWRKCGFYSCISAA